VPELLRRSIESADRQRFSGLRRVEFRREGKTLAYDEVVVRDGVRMRIEFPEGSRLAGQIIVDDGQTRLHFFPDKNEIRQLPSRIDPATRRLRRLLERGDSRLRFRREGAVRIAGLRAESIAIEDSGGNVVQRMRIEPRTAVVLSRTLYDPVGTALGGFEFTRIDLRPRIRPDVFRIVRRGATLRTPLSTLAEAVQSGEFLPVRLGPESGYRLEYVRKIDAEGREALVQGYRKDAERITLVQSRRPIQEAQLKRLSSGRVQVHRWTESGRTFLLMGSVSQDALRLLVRDVVRTPVETQAGSAR
jgi:hypothetical protein